jgi:deferrochelatase/peroxidase EfeB
MDQTTIDYTDVQGTILRGYRVDLARHFILQVTEAAAAQRLIGSMVDGSPGVPQITTAARPASKPDFFMNIGITSAGLHTLGLTADQLQTFDPAFQRGAANQVTANSIGDVGESAPGNWIGGLSDASAVHVVLSVWVTKDPAVLEQLSSVLRGLFTGAFKELSAHDARALPDNKVHFGYRDSIAQPTVLGAPPRKHKIPDDQPVLATGEFLLGYLNEIGGTTSVQPSQLTLNSSYSSFRILEQDVEAFEEFLQVYAKQAGIDPEMLAAKICGRWRNGNPLELMPDHAGEPLPLSEINNFQYVPSGNAPPPEVAYDDTLGLRCPIGSHIRRNNPRAAGVVGGGSSVNHRIVRRAMPYGPNDSEKADAPRGLIGHFINASIANQFEFLMSQWNQTSQFVKAAKGTNCSGNAVLNISGEDLFLGINDAASSSFTLSTCVGGAVKNTAITGFERLITTRGGVYLFLPSITGLRYLATLGAPSA